jgi:chromosome segregation ATPase
MKNIKDIAITVLAILCIIFAAITFFGGDSKYKHQIEALQNDNKRLHTERDSIIKAGKEIQSRIDSLTIIENRLKGVIADKDIEISKAKSNAQKSKAELDSMRQKLEKIRKQIADAKKNPPNREGEDLINSLKIKTQ